MAERTAKGHRASADPRSAAAKPEPVPPIRSVAVIDIGSGSIRMAIAEIDADGKVRTLDALNQPAPVGKDTFTRGRIRRSTIEECVQILTSFKRIMAEYGVTDPKNIRAVATSAVREASNREQLLDRIYIATGIVVEAIDEAEVNRLTYLTALPVIRGIPRLWNRPTLIVEVGGGSTELLVVEAGVVRYSGTYRLGSLRLHEMLGSYESAVSNVDTVMKTQIQRTLDQMRLAVESERPVSILLLGGDARFAASELNLDWDAHKVTSVSSGPLRELANHVVGLSPDEIVQQHKVPYEDADALGPALLSMSMLADTFGVNKMLVASTTLRDGLLAEMASQTTWTEEFRKQSVQSAIDLGRKFHFDEGHSLHVAMLCRNLFAELEEVHQLEARYELLLYIAAVLHEIGLVIHTRSHHKHSMYLILNSDLFGLSRRDQRLVAMVARYHRKASPSPQHEGYSQLSREQRIVVAKLAALLRLADALDRAHSRRIREVSCRLRDDRVVVTALHVEEVTIERLAVSEKGSLFQQVFGKEVDLRGQSKKART